MLLTIVKWLTVTFFGIFLGGLGYIFFIMEPLFEPNPYPDLGVIPSYENTIFENTRLFDGIRKPEDLAMGDGVFYTGMDDGSIAKVDIETGNVEIILTASDFNPAVVDMDVYYEGFCNGNPFRGKYCGEVLGIKLSPNRERLIMTNKVFGIFEYDIPTKLFQKVVENDRRTDGGILEFYDDVTYGKGEYSRKIYYSKVSDKFDFKGMFNVIWENYPRGSIMEFDLETKKERVVTEHFNFPNGVLTVENFLYITDTNGMTITKFDLKENKVVKKTTFNNMYPDNLSYDPKSGKIYVAGTERSRIMEWISKRRLVLKLFTAHPVALALATLKLLRTDTGIINVVDPEELTLTDVIYDGTGSVFKGATSVVRVDDYFYVGSLFYDNAFGFGIKDFSE